LLIPVLVIEAVARGGAWTTAATVLNWVVWSAFLLEVVVMLAVVPDRGRWLRGHVLDVAIVVLTPPFVPASLQAGRFLRLFRLLRLLRLLWLLRALRRVFSLDGLKHAAVLTALAALGGGAAF